MNETNGIPKHVDEDTDEQHAHRLERGERTTAAFLGALERIKVKSVTFAPAPKPRELTSAETALLWALK